MTDTQQAPTSSGKDAAPGSLDGLKDAARGLGGTLLSAGISRAGGATEKLTSRLSDFAEGKKQEAEQKDAPGPVANAVKDAVIAKVEGENPATAAIKGALGGVKNKLTGGGKGGKDSTQKYTNIVEWIDVGVPLRVAFNQWTEFEQWTSFMKKVENVQRNEEQGKVAFKARVFLSHRSWESTIVEMVPDDHIVWQSTGQKGYLNGGVTFHELGPTLTRLCVVVEYHPQGFVEKTLNIWRAVGRAVRRELKRYVHQVMTHTILAPDEVEGWRAEIRDKKIVRTHDEVVEQEQREAEEAEAQADEAQGDDESYDEVGSEEPGAVPSPTDEAEADAAEDATYLDEAGIGQEGQAPEGGSDEEVFDEDRGSDTADEDESSDDDDLDGAGGEDAGPDEGSPDGGDESGDDDQYDDEYEEDDYESDEYEGDEGDYEEPEGEQDSGDGEQASGEPDTGEHEEDRAGTTGDGTSDPGDSAPSGTPTPNDVASGMVHPPETPRPRRRQRTA